MPPSVEWDDQQCTPHQVVGSRAEAGGRGQGEEGAEVSYKSRVGASCEGLECQARCFVNWAWLPLTQTEGKGRWSEGSACRPFETKPGYRHPAAAETHLHWTPSWLQLELEWWGREGHLQFRSGADGRTSLEEVGGGGTGVESAASLLTHIPSPDQPFWPDAPHKTTQALTCTQQCSRCST